LGLNDLDLKPEDHRFLEVVRRILGHRWIAVADGILSPEFADKYFKNRLQFLDIIHRFFWKSSVLVMRPLPRANGGRQRGTGEI
jgi:hypothetical protein